MDRCTHTKMSDGHTAFLNKNLLGKDMLKIVFTEKHAQE